MQNTAGDLAKLVADLNDMVQSAAEMTAKAIDAQEEFQTVNASVNVVLARGLVTVSTLLLALVVQQGAEDGDPPSCFVPMREGSN
jgi:phage-related minor tail protein